MNQFEEPKDWREISKGQGALITLGIMSAYISLHWGITQGGYFWVGKLNIAFFIGIIFAWLAKIKPGTEDTLCFLHADLTNKWGPGLCLVPYLFPALSRIELYLGWSLKEMHHETPSQETIPYIHHDLRIDGRNIQQINATTDFWTLKKWEIFAGFIRWFFSKNKNPILVFQDFGLKIILVVLFLDCISLGTAGVVNTYHYFFPAKEEVTYTVVGECIDIPRDSTKIIAMTSLPRKFPTGLKNEVQVLTPRQIKTSWRVIFKLQELPQEMTIVATSKWWRSGEVCF